MKRPTHYYVSRKSAMAWLMTIFLSASFLARIWVFAFLHVKEGPSSWLQLLPLAATALFIAIVLMDGKEHFYRTAIPIWMLAIYAGIWGNHHMPNRIMVFFFWIALVFFAFLYTELTSGIHYRSIWLLFPMFLLSLGVVGYCYRRYILSWDWYSPLLPRLPDILLLVGLALLTLDIRISPSGEYHPTWGDRSDGRKLRSLPPIEMMSPYIMVSRNTATNKFAESFEITAAERYIRQKRKEGLTQFGMTHVLLATYCRAVARYPGLNRFVSGQKLYTHGEDIQFCMAIKKEMNSSSPDTDIKVHLSVRDTAEDVYRKLNAVVEEVKNTPLNSDFDKTAEILTHIPGLFLKFTVWFLKLLDYFGLIPKFLLEVSSFHGSVFFTSMGSLGIPPIYHHLYDFGNLPVFLSFGCKRKELELQPDGTMLSHKYIDFKISMDERIVDGFYYAAFFKYFRRLLQHPEILDQPPETVVPDVD